MLIWINGTFGAGKTQTAYELHRRLEKSYVFDPENAGFYLQRNVPRELRKDDFQDYRLWREINYSMLSHLVKEYDGILIVPMTIVNHVNFIEIVGRLRNDGVDVRHFTLSASKETVLKRLKSRGDGANSWPAKKLDRCMEGLSHEMFEEHIPTDNMTISEIVEHIANRTNVSLKPDQRGTVAKFKDRLIIKLKHLRWFG
ncbi:AAA family ATPase [Cohnella candidum]|uniref:Tunicamycin resistance protein n=1 Tax=Cohnella candidum TaxID=2674991 RepID=A0A3G3K519_9BACL|nr:AAA family ATPase [Cohnella candidum]AYQ75542.1 tunicamycin resistance protein [Cohnella candidum]